jgi:predicted NBD/HSP70 family sugar kinase
VGGAGHFSIWLDNELLHGHSGACGTFGSPCLSHKDEFKVAAVELWQMA